MKFLILIDAEKDDCYTNHDAFTQISNHKPHSFSSSSSSSSAAVQSEHLMKLNLDIGSMAEVCKLLRLFILELIRLMNPPANFHI